MTRQFIATILALVLAAASLYADDSLSSTQCAEAGGPAKSEQCMLLPMEEIVVTGTRTSKKIMNSPVSLSLINQEQLSNSTADGIADIIRDLPGISVTDSGQAGLKRIRIRGQESRRIAVLIDGQESTDHREVGVPLLIDPGMVERIEVVRGPASVLYGAKALGGVVNIITRKAGDESFQGLLSSSYNSSSQGINSLASVFGNLNDYGYRLSLSSNDQKERRTPAGTVENTRYDSKSLMFNISKSVGIHHLEAAYENYQSDAEVYVEPEVRFTLPFLDFAIDAPQRDRRKVAAFYRVEPSVEFLAAAKLDAYRQVSDRQFNTFPSMFLPFPPPGMRLDSSIYTSSRLITDGASVQLDWQPGWHHYLVTGIQYNRDQVDQLRDKQTRINLGTPTLEMIFDQASIDTYAIYVQDDWQFKNSWSLVAGFRNYWVEGSLDQTNRGDLVAGNLKDNHMIGSLSLLFSGYDDTVIRGTLAQGYVYPSLLQLATGAYAGSRFINPNLKLEPETSNSLELGLRHQTSNWIFDGTLFANQAENYIDHLLCTAADDCLTSRDEIYRNIGASKSFGMETAIDYVPEYSNLKPYLNLSWFRRRNETDGVDSYKTGIPNWQGRVGVRHSKSTNNFNLWSDLFIRFESSVEELDISGVGVRESHRDRWLSVNLNLGFAFKQWYRLNLDLKNITDRKYMAATENLWAEQRSVHLKLSLNI